MDDLEPFESPKLLIEGAKASIGDLEALCTAFVKEGTYDVITHTDPKTREEVIKLRFHKRISGTIRYKASGILNDIRHAADHAFCDAVVGLGYAGKVDALYFPIAKTASDLDGKIKGLIKAGIDPDILRFVRSFNAHYGGDNQIYALTAIAGPNKHQRIHRISLGDSGSTIDGSGAWMLRGNFQLGINKWNELRNELEFMRIGPNGAFQGHIGRDFSPVLQVVIGTGEPPFSGPAPTVLRDLASKFEGIVLGIEAETARIIRERS